MGTAICSHKAAAAPVVGWHRTRLLTPHRCGAAGTCSRQALPGFQCRVKAHFGPRVLRAAFAAVTPYVFTGAKGRVAGKKALGLQKAWQRRGCFTADNPAAPSSQITPAAMTQNGGCQHLTWPPRNLLPRDPADPGAGRRRLRAAGAPFSLRAAPLT